MLVKAELFAQYFFCKQTEFSALSESSFISVCVQEPWPGLGQFQGHTLHAHVASLHFSQS